MVTVQLSLDFTARPAPRAQRAPRARQAAATERGDGWRDRLVGQAIECRRIAEEFVQWIEYDVRRGRDDMAMLRQVEAEWWFAEADRLAEYATRRGRARLWWEPCSHVDHPGHP